MNLIDPNAPAYPFTVSEGAQYREGIPIRLEIASRVLAGFMSDINGFGEAYIAEPSLSKLPIHEAAAVASLTYADALVAAYNGSTKEG